MFRIHETSPAAAVEEAYARIYRERMFCVPVHNNILFIEAIDFQRWQGHWLGVVLTSWCMSALLVPGKAEEWETVGDNQRRFVKFPAGDFAFLGNEEPELGEYQSCSLFSPMNKFTSQSQAIMTARASLAALLSVPGQAKPEEKKASDQPSLSRRRFLTLR